MKKYQVHLTQLAKEDLDIAKDFYAKQDISLGEYFIDSLIVDLESLQFYSGIHQKIFGYYKMLAKHFPFTIYYDIENTTTIVHAILDTRQNPKNIKDRLIS